MTNSLHTEVFSAEAESSQKKVTKQDIRNKAYSTLANVSSFLSMLESIQIRDPSMDYMIRNKLYQMREDMIGLIALTYDIDLNGLKVHGLIALLNKHLAEHPDVSVISEELHEAILDIPEDTQETLISNNADSRDAISILQEVFNIKSKSCSNCRFHESHDYLDRFYCRNRECDMHNKNDISEQHDCPQWEKEVFGESSRGSCETCKYCTDLADNKCYCICADERRHYLVGEDIEPMTDCSFWSPKPSGEGLT